MTKAKTKENTVEVIDTSSIRNELKEYVNTCVDEKIDTVFQEKVKKQFIEEIEKRDKKIIKEKNHKIILRNIIILLLVIVIIFLVRLLYQEGYFDSYLKHDNTIVEKEENKEEKEEEEVKEEKVSLEELKEQYGNYLDSYVLSNESSYVEEFYQKGLTNSLKEYFTLRNLDFQKLEVEEDYQVILEEDFLKQCSVLFDQECSPSSFVFDDNKVRYFDKLNSFITDKMLEKNSSSIQREILDIEVDGDVVVITTLEGIVTDNQLYSVYPYQVISEYHDEGFYNYSESLNKVIYTFKNHKLKRIEKGI